MAQDEFDYTTKMINQDLSNFSAWHNRSKVILKMLDEKQATDEERKEMLDSGDVFLASRRSSSLIEHTRTRRDPQSLVRSI